MKKIALSTVLASASLLATSLANAQDCPPGSWLCAGLQIGAGVSGGVVIGGGRPALPPPPPPPPPPASVVVQTPMVEFQPAPPVYLQPPQPVVIYRPAPVIYTTYAPVQAPAPTVAPRQNVGLGAYATGLFLGGSDSARERPAMGGAGVLMRFRHSPHLATEATIGGMYGRDYNGDARAEVPVTLGGVVYFNPRNRFQVYGLLGGGLSFATVQYDIANARTRGMRDAGYFYLGGYAGIGAEWQLSQSFSLFVDVRGFIRGRVDRDAESNPEFSRVQGGVTQTTNGSMGMTGNLGAMFWF
jgi:hypothetical protein